MKLYEIMRIIGIIIGGLGLYYLVLIITIKRNVKKVIKIFEEKNSLDVNSAISEGELGIKKQGFVERAIKSRKNEIHALKFLMEAGIVLVTSNGKFYYDKRKIVAVRKDGNFIGRFILPDIDN